MALDIGRAMAYDSSMNTTPDAWAIQPKSFGFAFDECGCVWAKGLDHAKRLGERFAELEGEAYVVWKVTLHGEMAWMTVGS
jgi:hypothetical protein